MTRPSLTDVISDLIEVEAQIVTQWLTEAAPRLLPFDHNQALADLERLSHDADSFYDCPAVGGHYAAWYHLERSANLVEPLWQLLEGRNHSDLVRIVDVGVGTGASAAAVAALMRADIRGLPEHIDVHGIDSSQIMLNTCMGLDEYRRGPKPALDSALASWRAKETAHNTSRHYPTLLVTSYLFDHSDKDPGRAEALARGLLKVVDLYNAEAVAITGGQSKRTTVERTIEMATKMPSDVLHLELKSASASRTVSPKPATERLKALRATRQKWAGFTHPFLNDLARLQFKSMHWMLDVHRATFTLDTAPEPWPRCVLDEDQLRAARPNLGQPTYVQGPAGSGKSLTLVEHVAQLTETPGVNDVLVTTFNRRLAARLAEDIVRRLDVQATGSDGHFQLTGTNTKILVTNRDKIGPRLFGLPFERAATHPNYIDIARQITYEEAEGILAPGSTKRWQELLEDRGTEFIKSELEAFIYGLNRGHHDYLTLPRRGAGTRLSEAQRELVWWALEWQRKEHAPLWGHRRQDLYRWAIDENRAPRQTFDYVVVDEGQDFSDSDFRILLKLLKPTHAPSRLSVFGDPNQSVHLGGSWRRPTVEDRNGETLPFEKARELRSSYRLPWMVAKALEPLAERIEKIDETLALAADRSALPGPRPVVIDGDGDIRQSVASSLRAHGLERSEIRATPGLCGQLRCPELTSKAHKGLEFNAVVVGTTEHQLSAETHWFDLYTLLTRTTRLLIIAASQDAPRETREALRLLDEDCLRFHDEAANHRWREMLGTPS